MGSEIGNKGLLRRWADYLQILGQHQAPPDLEVGKVQLVVDISKDPVVYPPTPTQVQDTLLAYGVDASGSGHSIAATALGRLYLISLDSEDGPMIDVETIDATNTKSNGPLYGIAAGADIKVDGFSGYVLFDAAGAISAAGKRLCFKLWLDPSGDGSTVIEIAREESQGIAPGTLVYFFDMAGVAQRANASSQGKGGAGWDGFFPKGFNSLKLDAFFTDASNFPANTSMGGSAYGRIQINNGYNGAAFVARPLGLS